MLNVLFMHAAVSGLFGKLLKLAYEEVILELVRTKCTPILLYGLECFQLRKADRHSLDSTFNRLCMKLFKTGNIDVAKDCQSYFACRAVILKEGTIGLPPTFSQ